MKVFVLNPPFVRDFCRAQRWAARTRGRVQRPPDWLAYCTSILEQNGHKVELLDAAAKNMPREEVYQKFSSFSPDILVTDSTTPSIYNDINIAKKCKSINECTTIMVGPHASALPKETLKLSKGAIDIIVRGEYDYIVSNAINAIESGRDLKNVDGITYKEKGKIEQNKDAKLIEDLESLPYPAWHQIDIKDYFDGGKLYPFTDIIAGRGCPFRCSFCLYPQVMHGHKYRLRSAKNVVDEMEYDIENYPYLKELFFEDDTFLANKKRAKEICDEIIQRKLDITWSINCRCDVVDRGLFHKMKRAGCRMVLVGPESGSQKILDNINKKLTVQKVKNFVNAVKEAKIQIHSCFVLGLPGETKKTIQKTIDYALDLDTDTIQFSAAVPFPGTELYSWAKERGHLKATKWSDWLNEGEQSAVVDYPYLSSEEISKSVDYALKRFYLRPKKILQLLTNTRGSLTDFYRKFRGAKNFLTYLIESKT